MQRMSEKIRDCDCEWERVYPGVWVLVSECRKCRAQRRIQMQFNVKEMEEEKMRSIRRGQE